MREKSVFKNRQIITRQNLFLKTKKLDNFRLKIALSFIKKLLAIFVETIPIYVRNRKTQL